MDSPSTLSWMGASLRPQDAIDALKRRSDLEVIAFLTFARSVEEDLHFKIGGTALSIDEFNAVLSIRNWTDAAVIRELQSARRTTFYGLQTQRFLTQDVNVPRGNAFDANITENDVSFQDNPFGLERVLEKSLTRDLDQTLTEPQSRKRKRGNPEHHYWCTICGYDDPHSYSNSSSWKKHEKAHEVTYRCLLNETVETLKGGKVCKLCGLQSPDDVHMSSHNISACLNAHRGPPNFKRRYQLQTHLNDQHECTNSENLAEEWCKTSEKQAWSCGFCIALFSSNTERLQHIQSQHFDQGQTLDEWNQNNVIKGLLQQPMIREAWLVRLETEDPCTHQNLMWNLNDISTLEKKLEVGVTTFEEARNLALDVWGHVEIDLTKYINGSNEAATNPVPAPLLNPNQSRGLKNRRNLISSGSLTLDLQRDGFAGLRSARGPSHYLDDVDPPQPEIRGISSAYHFRHQMTQDERPGDHFGDSGGLATPLSDVNFNTQIECLQSSTGDEFQGNVESDLFDGFM